MTDNLIKRLTAGATGAGNLPKDLYRKDCADALAEIQRLRAIVRVNGLRWGHSHAEIGELLNQQRPNKE